jgi:hypothetical protein
MKNKYRILLNLIIVIYSIILAFFILFGSYNSYDWMLFDPEYVKEGLGFCGLPVDDDADFWKHITALGLIPLGVIGGFFAIQRRFHYSIILILILAVMWFVKWVYLSPVCPGRTMY